mmetsp:Transcript_77080/g.226072  ORF Transcript_77080/g.226072 Transcript_77080/m.226072 type:complete len:206 (-) Transcript_77080:13-630(-)
MYLLELFHGGCGLIYVVLSVWSFWLVGLGEEILDLQLLVQGNGQRQRCLQGPCVRRHNDALNAASRGGVILKPARSVLGLLDPTLSQGRVVAHEGCVEAWLLLRAPAVWIAAVLVAVPHDVHMLSHLAEAAEPQCSGRGSGTVWDQQQGCKGAASQHKHEKGLPHLRQRPADGVNGRRSIIGTCQDALCRGDHGVSTRYSSGQGS